MTRNVEPVTEEEKSAKARVEFRTDDFSLAVQAKYREVLDNYGEYFILPHGYEHIVFPLIVRGLYGSIGDEIRSPRLPYVL